LSIKTSEIYIFVNRNTWAYMGRGWGAIPVKGGIVILSLPDPLDEYL